MTQLFRVRTTLSGFAGAPGLATMYFLDVATAHGAVHDFWAGCAAIMPSNVRIQVIGGADIIESTTGRLVGSVPTAQPGSITATGAAVYAAPVGILARWTTDAIVAGKRVRGHTFIVPVTNANFDEFGQVTPGTVTGLQVATNALKVSQNTSFVVWSRPFEGKAATATRPAIPRRDGSHALVTGTGVSSKAVVLRSRRD